MAAFEWLHTNFLQQNALYLSVLVATSVVAVILSSYYLFRGYFLSNLSIGAKEKADNAHKPASSEVDIHSTFPNGNEVQKQCFDAQNGIEEKENIEDSSVPIDPVIYCEHIQGEIKKVKQKVATRKICESLTPEQLAEEKERQAEQLAEIFRLMQNQSDRFGINSMEEMNDQLRLYTNF